MVSYEVENLFNFNLSLLGFPTVNVAYVRYLPGFQTGRETRTP